MKKLIATALLISCSILAISILLLVGVMSEIERQVIIVPGYDQEIKQIIESESYSGSGEIATDMANTIDNLMELLKSGYFKIRHVIYLLIVVIFCCLLSIGLLFRMSSTYRSQSP